MSTAIHSYPETKKINVVNSYFGIDVQDPYQWLEEAQAPETQAWIEEQNKATATFFDRLPSHGLIQDRLEKLWDHERYSAPFQAGGYTYFYKNEGLQDQSILYRQQEGEMPGVFLDPTVLSEDGSASLDEIIFSADGSLAAFQVTENGSDLKKVYVIRSADKRILGEPLVGVIFSRLAWKDNQGFFYSCYQLPAASTPGQAGMVFNHQLYYHELGTPQEKDQLVFGGEKMPRRFVQADVTGDGDFLVIMATNVVSGNELYIKSLRGEQDEIITVVDHHDYHNFVIHNRGTKFYIHTNKDAPNYKVVITDIADPLQGQWQDHIPVTSHVLHATTAGGKIFAHYLEDATSIVRQFSMEGAFECEVPLPASGSAFGFRGKENEKEVFYTFTAYNYPATIYKYHVETREVSVFKEAGISFAPGSYVSEQVFYNSKDGTRIPMTLTYKKGIELHGKNPTLLYGYGGFGFNVTPGFDVSNIILLEQGGILAVPNLRGGGEYGKNWHMDGTKLNKKNVIDDFIAAAEYLTVKRYTSREYLAISGRSNGGMVVGSALAQRPDLCQVALPAVGLMDLLRYHQFGSSATWAGEYGTSLDSKTVFEYLLSYSPYHILAEKEYPAVLITTADRDDRVWPAHSFKFTARLQECQLGNAPVLLYVEHNAGHGVGKTTKQRIKQEVDKWAFMFYHMGIELEHK